MSRLAFDLYDLKGLQLGSVRIECVETIGNDILLGTQEGTLIAARVDTAEQPPSCMLRKLLTQFTKKSIQQLCAIERLNLLLTLSDSVISVHDLRSFEFKYQLARSKGCSCFAVDMDSDTFRLAVAVKKKLVFFLWNGERYLDHSREINIPDTAKQVLWINGSLWVSTKREYTAVDFESGSGVEIMTAGQRGSPIMLALPDHEVLLLRDNTGCIFSCVGGRISKKSDLSFSDLPTAVAFSAPYVLAACPRFIDVRSVAQYGGLVQQLPQKGMAFLSAMQGDVVAGSQNQFCLLRPVPFTKQIQYLHEMGEYREAIVLLDMVPDTEAAFKEAFGTSLHYHYGLKLFAEKDFAEAMTQFSQAPFDVRLLAFFPTILPRDKQDVILPPIDPPSLSPQETHDALVALTDYLMERRHTDPHLSAEVTARIVDTALLKGAVAAQRPQLVQALIHMPNQCDVHDCAEALLEEGMVKEMVDLYRSKGMHEPALSLLRSLAKQADSPLSGVGPTVAYLKQLEPQNETDIHLILKYADWVLDESVPEGLAIFKTPRDRPIPPLTVLQHFEEKKRPRQLSIEFLEWVIHGCGDETPALHDELIALYLAEIDALRSRTGTGLDAPPPGGETSLATRLKKLRERLTAFLESSQFYRIPHAASLVPHELYAERAIIFSRLHQHAQALEIYALELKDFGGALKYCEKHYSDESEETRHLYSVLLRLYLKPPKGGQPQLGPAIALLNMHFQHMDKATALEAFPASTELEKLRPFFENVLRSTAKRRQDQSVLHNLLRAEHLQYEEARIHARSRRVVIDDTRACPVCNRRLGLVAIAVFPDGVVVHFKCKDRYMPAPHS